MEDHDLLEFEKLKDEQIGRLTYRDTLFYFTMTIIGGALAIALSDKDKDAIDILLLVPFVIFIGGVAHITCDRRIEDIGNYVHDYLSIAVAERAKVAPPTVFAWETFFRNTPLHWWRKLLQFIANQMLYSGSGLAILAFYSYKVGTLPGYRPLPIDAPVKWIGVALMVVMFVLITIFSFFKWKQIQRGEMASTTGRIIGKVVLASFCAAVMGGAIIGGARYAQGPLGTWLNGPAWQVQPVYVVALLVAMIVWSIVLLVGRR